MTTLRPTLEIADELIARTYGVDGGCTVPLVVGQQRPTTGYAVALKGGLVLNQLAGSSAKIIHWVATHRARAAYDPNGYLGGWLDPNAETYTLYVDVVKVVPERAQAEALARENDQIAYQDLSTGETVRLNERSKA